jgi:hypothetical protein
MSKSSGSSQCHALRLPLRTAILAVAIVGSAIFSSQKLAAVPPSLLSDPLELRSKNHVLSLTLGAAIASDDKPTANSL